ncbi:hypothetical protein CLV49_1391 [Labedella gwakjiensis]|uniref:Uncharacterized protein n=1 Tax=Labedella gwakjiensis TaxID=390269 RepID=A0A2P8GUZ1_9MICO|nr:hypothetical protein [Labedella gwakjiensis]PSL37784.1 hypothetical protein CLV49_1391 [Labedella gwakjiensis]RUQ87635.1 hypothetical protein ELQ93_12240 [Labedella gwakjiensis]
MTSAPIRRPSVKGPAWLTWIGVVLLVASVAIAIATVSLFASLLPTGFLNQDGTPGDDVIASIDAGESASVELDGDTSYSLLLVRPTDESSGALTGDVALIAPDGTTSVADRAPAVSTRVSGGQATAASFAAFETTDDGAYTITVPAATDDQPTSVLVVEDGDTLPFVGGVFGSIGGVFAVLLLGIPGLGLTIGGAIWWSSRRRARRAYDAGQPTA